jgi:polyhydroxyalkanoate synthesis regulator protein
MVGLKEVKMNAEEMNGNKRIIKKYQNRKLYDTLDSKYVTLDDIALMIKRGEEIVVVDNQIKKMLQPLF